jgi:pyridoxamine 5'-phosphate oxidase
MTEQELMQIAQRILEDVKTAVLATNDSDGRPHMRWMTPTVLRGRPGLLYALTAPGFAKVVQLGGNPSAEWMIQSRSLSEVVHLRGRINVVDNPSLKAELLEQLGPSLHAFWKACTAPDCVVLEMVPEQGVYHVPMKGVKETIDF